MVIKRRLMSNKVIEFRDASVFQGNKEILAQVNLNIFQGDFVYFIGRVGSGKTSLVKVIHGELPLHKGKGRVLDYNLERLTRKQRPLLRRRIGVAFQDLNLLSDRNVFDNLQFVLKATGWSDQADINHRIDYVLNYVGLPEKIHEMPNRLSGGEKQRIVLARAMLNDPQILIADEPTGNVDPDTSDEIMKILVEIRNNGRTVIMITHDYSLLKKYPFRVYKFENARVIEQAGDEVIDFDQLQE